MDVSVSEAKGLLLDLVRRAEAGEDVVLTRRGTGVVRLVPISAKLSPEAMRAQIEEIVASARRHRLDGPSAACSQDFLYDEDGLPA